MSDSFVELIKIAYICRGHDRVTQSHKLSTAACSAIKMMDNNKDKVSNWGGFRPGAGNKYRWRHGETKAVRIPIAIADKILEVARVIDSGEQIKDELTTQSSEATNQKYSAELVALKADLAKVTRELQQVTEERDNLKLLKSLTINLQCETTATLNSCSLTN